MRWRLSSWLSPLFRAFGSFGSKAPALHRVGLASVLVGAIALTAAVAHGRLVPDTLTLPGLRIGAEVVPVFASEGELRRWVEGRAESLASQRVSLRVEGEAEPAGDATLAELGVAVDVTRVVERARLAGHVEDLLERVARAKRARAGGLDVPLGATVDSERARARLRPIKEAADVAPVSARLDPERGTIVPEELGRYVDLDGAIAAIERAIASDEDPPAQITLPVSRVAPRYTSAYVKNLDVHAVLASYETHFSRGGDQARRGKNIDVAASKLDGRVLAPGEMFSFNDVVGERSEENGFQKSWEILKGEMVEGVGGGTCQVASTLYAVAFFGGLDVLERLPHSRPSAYIPMGLDATVVYPEVDMKLRNPFPFPVMLHAKVARNTLRIELLGSEKPARVTFERELVESFPYARKIEEDDTLRGNTVVVRQHGIRGFKMKRTRTLMFSGGVRRKEETNDKYPATTEIYEVPPGFDVTRLPPLVDDDPDEDAAGPTSLSGAVSVPPPATAIPPVPVGPAPTTATMSSAPPPGSLAAAAVACTGECGRATDLVFVEAPGAHVPTDAQAHPPKTFKLHR